MENFLPSSTLKNKFQSPKHFQLLLPTKNTKIGSRLFKTKRFPSDSLHILGVKRIIGVCCSFFCSANIKNKTDGMLQPCLTMCTKLIVCIRSSITKLNLKIENCFSSNKHNVHQALCIGHAFSRSDT